MKDKTINSLFGSILILTTLIGVILLFNRLHFINFFPQNNFIILMDHLFSGFLIPLWFYILFIGMASFFDPERKIIYRKVWFLYASSFLLMVLISWEVCIQKARDVEQILFELLGLSFSWVYFLNFKRLKKK